LIRLILLRVFVAYFIFLFASCTTLTPIENLTLPVVAEPRFSPCIDDDGAFHLKVSDGGANFLGSMDFEWVSRENKDWVVQAYNQMGQTPVSFAYTDSGNNLIIRKPKALALPEIRFDRDRFLNIDGHFIPISAVEIPCFLKGRLPKNWLRGIVKKQRNGDWLLMRYQDAKREVDISIHVGDSLTRVEDCASLEWSPYWFLPDEQVVLCFDKKKNVQIKGIDNLEVTWKILEE